MKIKKGLNSLENILIKISKKPKLKKRLEGVEVLDQLDNILGENLKSYIKNKYFQNGIIYLYLNSSVLRKELSFQKESIINSINKNIGSKLVKDFILR